MRRVLLAIGLYLGGGAALMALWGWWLVPSPASVPTVDGSFAYPEVVPPGGRDAAAWKAGHLDGWKWCLEHLREGGWAGDDELGGYVVGVADRDEGFRLGYATARAHAQHRLTRDDLAAIQRDLARLRRRQPALYDLTVSAPPP